jgi:homoserine O-succinyltransferase
MPVVMKNRETSPDVAEDSAIRIGLINNMPDAALQDTEIQFVRLLDEASGALPVHLSLFSLPSVLREERGVEHLKNFYLDLNGLWNTSLDALIITGTEPKQRELRNEPYWKELTAAFDWAERNTVSTVLSCLAAHAAVLHSDGIERQPLADKQFGVFDFATSTRHRLTAQCSPLRFPHSRWNGLSAEALKSAGYTILTQSSDAGVDSFVKVKRDSLFVHFQGHPEYETQTLLKEYRRDIRRFLRSERETYPTMPHGYFGGTATAAFDKYQLKAKLDRTEDSMSEFPATSEIGEIAHSWKSSSISVYRNWLGYIASRKTESKGFLASACHGSSKAHRAETR